MRSAWSERQVATLAALATAVLFVVGSLLAGTPPKFNDSGLKMVQFFHNHHKAVLIGTILIMIGVAMFLFVIAQLALAMGAMGQRSLAAMIGIAGAATAGLIAAGSGLYGGLAQLATAKDPATLAGIRPLYELDQFISTAVYWTGLVIVVALALAGLRGAAPSWLAPLNLVVGIVFVLGGISVKATGAFAAGTGAIPMIGGIALVVMVLEFGMLFRRTSAEAVHAPATMPV